MLATPKGVPTPPPQGQNSQFPKIAPRWLSVPHWGYDLRERESPDTGATPPSRAANALRRGMLFRKCISSYKPGFPKCRNNFSYSVSVPQQRQKSYLQRLRSYNETAAVIRKIQVSQQVFRFCYTCNTSTATRCCSGFSQPYPCTTIPRGHCFRCRSEQALCSASDRDRSDFPQPMP